MLRTQVNGIKGCRLRVSIRNSIMYVTYSQLAQVVILSNFFQVMFRYVSIKGIFAFRELYGMIQPYLADAYFR